MKVFRKPITRRAPIAGIALVLGCLLLGAIDLPQTPTMQRSAAARRWATQPFSTYRMALRVEYLNRTCYQEIEAEGERVRRMIKDTCRVSWFSSLTVERLFDIIGRIEQAPTCYPDSEPCACRLVRIGRVSYDSQIGYPSEIAYRREVQPNWWHIDFWKRLWDRKNLPTCSPTRSLHIVVSSFTPLP